MVGCLLTEEKGKGEGGGEGREGKGVSRGREEAEEGESWIYYIVKGDGC